ncbi:argininosuccinate lyase, partial [Candidatus Micrarchaeota archaeon]|nr:argininosuccinate lyase [Candidatus Micrarchaeota archaeon]
MGNKMWQGAFSGASANIITFNSSENIILDEQLIFYDIIGSIAHVKMLTKQKILAKQEADPILQSLKQILQNYRVGKFVLDPSLEDVHTNIETAVTKLTPYGKKMHTARSRNDQVLVDIRMYTRDELLSICESLIQLQKSFVSLSKSQEGIFVGYTHTRVAQPITVSFWCDSFVTSFDRDIERLLDCFD